MLCVHTQEGIQTNTVPRILYTFCGCVEHYKWVATVPGSLVRDLYRAIPSKSQGTCILGFISLNALNRVSFHIHGPKHEPGVYIIYNV